MVWLALVKVAEQLQEAKQNTMRGFVTYGIRTILMLIFADHIMAKTLQLEDSEKVKTQSFLERGASTGDF